MPKPKIDLYAEALTNIRQLTLHASLQSEKNEHTKIFISSDKKIITAVHDGESSSIYLPTQISGTANVTLPTDKRTEFSARLQIDDVSQLRDKQDEPGSSEVPWSATELTPDAAIQCKSCSADIVQSGKINTWKDLPSDHWADLMDLWFCHKPHQGLSAHDHAAESKGFSAKSQVATNIGVGLVDAVSFLLHREDCLNLQEVPSSREENKIVRCDECKTITGSSPTGRPSIRLYKSRVQVRPDSRQGQDWQKYPAEVFLGAQLLSLIESSVSRKIVVHQSTGEDPTSSQQQGILVWVFNPDIYYSSSRRGPTAHRAMKIFYKDLPDPEKFLDDHSNTHEELVVPEDDYKEFKNALAESTDILPEAAQTFQDWTIGLLDRWEKHASGSARMDENPLNKKVEDGFELFKLPAGMAELYL